MSQAPETEKAAPPRSLRDMLMTYGFNGARPADDDQLIDLVVKQFSNSPADIRTKLANSLLKPPENN